ncbi:efflux RND transporter periplasmic adaptor subunit [Acidipila sp. EB88]|uniref:efflux RND transporter periplasmic adaptor subunit n=1 Tax=Acidipila sp. EB88 TaxID=2305226 RepID=UPI000F5F7501|nr:efflux RND transporter periplasmic adaptor subunit [Acidipila sp. EB88]RRA48447.1 efflux RND transporter periplasmic adaptor subunit [Acidipila sp. EB88]
MSSDQQRTNRNAEAQQDGQNGQDQKHKGAEHPHQEGEVQRREPLSTGKALVLIVGGLVLAVVLAGLGIIPRVRAQKRLTSQTDATAAPSVLVAKPIQGKPEDTLLLPGALQAYISSPIYARTSGYLTHWYADIGAHVRKGALLAVIESPEVDQQLKQAKADLATAEANARNATIQAKRYQSLLTQDAVSQQDTDNFTTSQLSTNTQVQSAQANVDRLQQLVGFERVYAPFDGVVTSRSVDVGQLINAGAATNQELFEVSQVSTLRVYVSIPQVDSLGAKRGTPAQLLLAEYPGRTFTGHIVRTASAIDPNTRTLLVEVDVDNRDGRLMPGAYAQVSMHLNIGVKSLVVPVPAMIFRAQGLQVAVVENGKAKLVPITVGQDDGRVVQVVSGITADSQVVQNPPDSIFDGEAVQIVQPTKDGASGGPAGGANTAEGAQQSTGSQQTGSQANTAASKQSSGAGGK